MERDGLITEADSVEVVTARNRDAEDARLRAVVAVINRPLHEAVKEIEPTQDEWMAAIRFLTATGHMCNDWRQNFIPLSDVLGVSMLVDAVNRRKDGQAGASESTVLGPLHAEGAPELPMGTDICLDCKGERMRAHGRTLDTEGRLVGGGRIDVWQASDKGFYDVQQKGLQPDFTRAACSARGTTGATGFGGQAQVPPDPRRRPGGAAPQGPRAAPSPARLPPPHD